MVVHQANPVIAIATVVFVVWRVILWRGQRRDLIREVEIWALFASALMVVTLTFLPMVIIFYDWTSGLNLIPLASIRQLLTETAPGVAFENIVGNVLLFVPFGLLLPLPFGKVRTPRAVAWRAAVVSVSIELLQWVTGARATDVDDIIFNTAGALAGYTVWPVTPSCAAISATGRPASIRSSTLRRNSAGYLLDTMTSSSSVPEIQASHGAITGADHSRPWKRGWRAATREVIWKPTTHQYTDSEKDQAVRLVRQLREELGTEHDTVHRVARQLGYGVESVRTWVRERDVTDGVAGPDAQRLRELEAENKDLN